MQLYTDKCIPKGRRLRVWPTWFYYSPFYNCTGWLGVKDQVIFSVLLSLSCVWILFSKRLQSFLFEIVVTFSKVRGIHFSRGISSALRVIYSEKFSAGLIVCKSWTWGVNIAYRRHIFPGLQSAHSRSLVGSIFPGFDRGAAGFCGGHKTISDLLPSPAPPLMSRSGDPYFRHFFPHQQSSSGNPHAQMFLHSRHRLPVSPRWRSGRSQQSVAAWCNGRDAPLDRSCARSIFHIFTQGRNEDPHHA